MPKYDRSGNDIIMCMLFPFNELCNLPFWLTVPVGVADALAAAALCKWLLPCVVTKVIAVSESTTRVLIPASLGARATGSAAGQAAAAAPPASRPGRECVCMKIHCAYKSLACN